MQNSAASAASGSSYQRFGAKLVIFSRIYEEKFKRVIGTRNPDIIMGRVRIIISLHLFLGIEIKGRGVIEIKTIPLMI